MKILPLVLLALCGCAPRHLNPGAQLPVTAVSDHDMALAAGEHSRAGGVVLGLYSWGGLGQIRVLDGGDGGWVMPHEVAHAANALNISFAEAIRLITPPNPTPEMAKKLALCWEIDAMGRDPWQSIYKKWGPRGVVHPEILARIGHEDQVMDGEGNWGGK